MDGRDQYGNHLHTRSHYSSLEIKNPFHYLFFFYVKEKKVTPKDALSKNRGSIFAEDIPNSEQEFGATPLMLRLAKGTLAG